MCVFPPVRPSQLHEKAWESHGRGTESKTQLVLAVISRHCTSLCRMGRTCILRGSKSWGRKDLMSIPFFNWTFLLQRTFWLLLRSQLLITKARFQKSSFSPCLNMPQKMCKAMKWFSEETEFRCSKRGVQCLGGLSHYSTNGRAISQEQHGRRLRAFVWLGKNRAWPCVCLWVFIHKMSYNFSVDLSRAKNSNSEPSLWILLPFTWIHMRVSRKYYKNSDFWAPQASLELYSYHLFFIYATRN